MSQVSLWGMLLVILGGGSYTTDLVSLIDAEGYFKARQVEVQISSMAELAGKDATESKEEIAQLLAIRWLGEHAEEVNKEKKAREVLEQLAKGKAKYDPFGFVREYAERALARLDKKPPSTRPLPENSLRQDAWQWFPEDVTFFGGMDFRSSRDFLAVEDAPIRSLFQMIPQRGREEFYQFIENVGNLRLDRVSFGFQHDQQMKRDSKIFVRFTGQGDRKRLIDFMRQNIREAEVKEEQGPNGEPITIVSGPHPPAFAIVGDGDLIMAGYEGNKKSLEVVEQALQVRSGRKPNLLSSSYADWLKNVPAGAQGVFMGELPEDMRRELTGGGQLFSAFPHRVNLSLTQGKDVVLRFQGNLENADEAKSFIESFSKARQLGIQGLDNLPPQLPLKPEVIQTLKQTLEDIKLEAKDAVASGSLQVSRDTVKALQKALEEVMKNFIR